MHNKINGEKYEQLIANGFIAAGFNVETSNQLKDQHWWDIRVNQTPIEIKSCQLAKRNGVHRGKRDHCLGKFDYKNKENLVELKKAKGWVVFIVYYHDEHIILGALPAERLQEKQERFALTRIIQEQPIKLEELMNTLRTNEAQA